MNKLMQKMGQSPRASKGLLVFAVLGLVGFLLLASSSGVWATPNQSPLRQTIPSPNSIAGMVCWHVNECYGGVTINLYSDPPPRTTTTLANGAYVFTDVEPAAHILEVVNPEGFTNATSKLVSAFMSEGGSATVDFDIQEIGTVSGVVFSDTNGDGNRDPDEDGIPGVTITLTSSADATTTDSSGFYSFAGVAAGAHTVEVTLPAGFVNTTPNVVPISVAADGAATADFGQQPIGTVSGKVFKDVDGDGAQYEDEDGISGVSIWLKDSEGSLEHATTTGDGAYVFTGVAAGSYIVMETDPDGFASTTPNEVPISVATDGAATANFGDQQAGTVSGRVFNDVNGDGSQGAGENGMQGVRVTLSGSSVETTTDFFGAYSFAGVAPGAYTVKVTSPTGFASTTSNAVPISVVADGVATVSFGQQMIGTVNGRVFKDTNGNGVLDPEETGIGGVTVKLKDSEGSLVDTKATAGDGTCVFTGVAAGSYTVEETDPEGFISTTANAVSIVVASDGAAAANFGDQPVGTVSGRVFNDTNGDGVQAPEEAGIGGVTIELRDSEAALVGAKTTAGDGTYLFTGVAEGSYTVGETDPEGFMSTTSNEVSIVVASDGAATANFGDQQVGTVSGKVFNDVDGDGAQDASEGGIGGVTIQLRDNEGGLVGMKMTTGDGAYAFSGMAAGSYTVEETDPVGFVSTTSNAVAVVVSADSPATANFGDRFVYKIRFPLLMKNWPSSP